MSSDPIAAEPLKAILDELRALSRKLNNVDARVSEVRAKMDSLEASVRTVQVGITDISERMSKVEETSEGRKRRRLNVDPLPRSNAVHSAPNANVGEDPATAMRAPAESPEANAADAAQGNPDGADELRIQDNAAGEQGDANAQFELGLKYFQGQGVQQDYLRAAELFTRAADEGHALARNNLGTMYLIGFGVAQNIGRAAKLYKLAANQGVALAQCALGCLYYDGKGVKQDFVCAAELYKFAANQGFADAQCALGRLYYDGKGVKQCFVQAAELFKLAADQGHAQSLRNLGVVYEEGRGVTRDLKRAEELYNLAANAGDAEARKNLAELHARSGAAFEPYQHGNCPGAPPPQPGAPYLQVRYPGVQVPQPGAQHQYYARAPPQEVVYRSAPPPQGAYHRAPAGSYPRAPTQPSGIGSSWRWLPQQAPGPCPGAPSSRAAYSSAPTRPRNAYRHKSTTYTNARKPPNSTATTSIAALHIPMRASRRTRPLPRPFQIIINQIMNFNFSFTM